MKVLSIFGKSSKVPRKELEQKLQQAVDEVKFSRDAIVQLEKSAIALQASLEEHQQAIELLEAKDKSLARELEASEQQTLKLKKRTKSLQQELEATKTTTCERTKDAEASYILRIEQEKANVTLAELAICRSRCAELEMLLCHQANQANREDRHVLEANSMLSTARVQISALQLKIETLENELDESRELLNKKEESIREAGEKLSVAEQSNHVLDVKYSNLLHELNQKNDDIKQLRNVISELRKLQISQSIEKKDKQQSTADGPGVSVKSLTSATLADVQHKDFAVQVTDQQLDATQNHRENRKPRSVDGLHSYLLNDGTSEDAITDFDEDSQEPADIFRNRKSHNTTLSSASVPWECKVFSTVGLVPAVEGRSSANQEGKGTAQAKTLDWSADSNHWDERQSNAYEPANHAGTNVTHNVSILDGLTASVTGDISPPAQNQKAAGEHAENRSPMAEQSRPRSAEPVTIRVRLGSDPRLGLYGHHEAAQELEAGEWIGLRADLAWCSAVPQHRFRLASEPARISSFSKEDTLTSSAEVEIEILDCDSGTGASAAEVAAALQRYSEDPRGPIRSTQRLRYIQEIQRKAQTPYVSTREMEGTFLAPVQRDASKFGRLGQVASNSPSKTNVLSVSLTQSTKRWLDKRIALIGGNQHEEQPNDDRLNERLEDAKKKLCAEGRGLVSKTNVPDLGKVHLWERQTPNPSSAKSSPPKKQCTAKHQISQVFQQNSDIECQKSQPDINPRVISTMLPNREWWSGQGERDAEYYVQERPRLRTFEAQTASPGVVPWIPETHPPLSSSSKVYSNSSCQGADTARTSFNAPPVEPWMKECAHTTWKPVCKTGVRFLDPSAAGRPSTMGSEGDNKACRQHLAIPDSFVSLGDPGNKGKGPGFRFAEHVKAHRKKFFYPDQASNLQNTSTSPPFGVG